MKPRPSLLSLALLVGLLPFTACGGSSPSSTASPTPTPTPSPTPDDQTVAGFTGNYGSQLTLIDSRLVVITLSVKDGTGRATGGVYVYREDQPNRSRHTGTHALIASGQIAGRVDPTTRALSLTGTLSNQDGSGSPKPLELTGTLLRFGTDHGSVVLKIDTDTFTGVFQ